MPTGKKVIIETLDGESHIVDNTKFYNPKRIKTSWEDRTEINFGANN